MALIPKQRSTSSLVQNIMNQPAFQRQMQRGGSVGRDKRAIGAESQILGGFVRQERDRLAQLDDKGYQLATRREKLGWQRQMASKQDALAARKMKSQEKKHKLAMTLGGLRTVASGFGVYTGWRDNRAEIKRHEERMDALQPHRASAREFNEEYFKNYDPGYK